MKKSFLLALCIMLTACQADQALDASEAEIHMAEMMGISVEEVRNQTPEEHMHIMQRLMQDQAATDSPEQVSGFIPGTGVDIQTLPEVQPVQILTVADGDTIDLNPILVRKRIGSAEFAMYGYNGQVPGPLIKAPQGAEITVRVQNEIDMETTVHWHGIRLDNASDGVPHITQEAILPGESFTYTVALPDEGIYWYHPHVREDIQQDMGLYGNLLVEPATEDAYGPTNQEQVLVLDDLLLDSQGFPVAYGTNDAFQSGEDDVNYALMGRYGNVMLVNGEPNFAMEYPQKSVVRFYVTNVANTRTFRIQIPGARLKLVGGDIGRYEREEWVEALTIAPAERVVIDAYFPQSGSYTLQHQAAGKTVSLSSIAVTETTAQPSHVVAYEQLRTNADVVADIDTVRPYFDKPVDKELTLTIDMHGTMGMMNHGDMMHGGDGIEWEDEMPQMNEAMRNDELNWKLVDPATGAENMEIDWQFSQGDIVKVRVRNDADSAHPMQHPLHFHGQRFLVLSMDGVPTENLVWKDTVLIPAGSTTDLLLEMSNSGTWMIHCHIAEHLSNGMMSGFTVR